jgi:hypothetical protein
MRMNADQLIGHIDRFHTVDKLACDVLHLLLLCRADDNIALRVEHHPANDFDDECRLTGARRPMHAGETVCEHFFDTLLLGICQRRSPCAHWAISGAYGREQG